MYFNGPVDHSVATDELALSLGADMNATVGVDFGANTPWMW